METDFAALHGGFVRVWNDGVVYKPLAFLDAF